MRTLILPDGYTRTGEFIAGLSGRRAKFRVFGPLLLAMLVIVIIAHYLFPYESKTNPPLYLMLVALFSVLIIHEVLHYIPCRILNLKPRFVFVKVPGYGFCPGVSFRGGYYTKYESLVILLLPQLITVVCIVWLATVGVMNQASEILFWVITLNLLGGLADIMAVGAILRHKKDTLYLSESVLTTGIYNRVIASGV